jgi:hypothetical protein
MKDAVNPPQPHGFPKEKMHKQYPFKRQTACTWISMCFLSVIVCISFFRISCFASPFRDSMMDPNSGIHRSLPRRRISKFSQFKGADPNPKPAVLSATIMQEAAIAI